MTLRMSKLTGIFPAMVTPFTNSGELDEENLREIIEYLIVSGVDGIMCSGSTGEGASLSKEERIRVIQITVDQVKNKVPIIAGTGAPSTKASIDYTQDAMDAGADAAMIVTPFYNVPTNEGLFEHYRTIAEKVDFPIVVYNIPQATLVNIESEVLMKLVEEIDTIVAIKESSGNISQIADEIRLVGDKISIFSGNDAGVFSDCILGCHGAIVAIANIAPKIVVEIFDAVKRGAIEEAKKSYYQLLPVALALNGEENWASRVKEMMNLQGLAAGFVRKPYLSLHSDEIDPLKKALQLAGLIS